jgi:fructosamine-3-kinase
MAQHKGLLPPERERLVFAIADRMNDLLADIPPEISLIHGDLWTGNYLCARDDTPVLFDPSAYYGHREMEIAYIELFGGFLRDFVTFYNAVWPLDSGYPQRRPVHQLYHLLNHLNHFGERYGSAIEDICRTSLAGINI